MSTIRLNNKITVYLEIDLKINHSLMYQSCNCHNIMYKYRRGSATNVTRLHLDRMYYCLDWFGLQCGAAAVGFH